MLKIKKSSGAGSIPIEILKLIKPNVCYPLKEIINLSFLTGIYPDRLKIAKVIPIFKNQGGQLLDYNYRLISLVKYQQDIWKIGTLQIILFFKSQWHAFLV